MIRKNNSVSTTQAVGLVLVLALSLTIATAPARVSAQALAAAPTAVTTIKNFAKVDDNYYRGSQPQESDIQQLKKLGIKTIIDLRKDKEPLEAEWVSRAGLQYFNIPMKASKAATEEQTSFFRSLINDPANWPVYVHCKGGRHRTGALTAVYRITHDGWTAEQAFAEMKRYQFDHGFFGGPSAQKKFVFRFYEQHMSK